MKFFGLEIRQSGSSSSSSSNFRSQSKSGASMRALEAVRGFGGIIRGIAHMFGGARNIYEVYGYKTNIGFSHMMGKFVRQDIAGRIVKMPSDAIWTSPPTFAPAVQEVIDGLSSQFKLWNALNRADQLAGMAPYAGLLIGVDDGQSLDKPVNGGRKNKIIYLQPYSSESLQVNSYEADPGNPRFGKPLTYALKLGQFPQDNSSPVARAVLSGNAIVHWSRVVHIAENVLENEIFGTPRLAQVFNLLDDMLKVGGGSAETYWLNARGGLHIDVDKEMGLEPTDAEALEQEIDDYAHNLRRVIRTRGVKIEPINMENADPTKAFEVILNLICASQGIPQRLLLGSEAGQLASEQDRASWAVTIKQRRQNFAFPQVIKPLLDALVLLGIIKQADANIRPEDIKWPEAFQLSPLERAQTSAQQARSAANLVKAIGTPATPATEPTTNPDGSVTPGTPGDPGIPALVSVEEARSIIFMGATGDAPNTSKVGAGNNDL